MVNEDTYGISVVREVAHYFFNHPKAPPAQLIDNFEVNIRIRCYRILAPSIKSTLPAVNNT